MTSKPMVFWATIVSIIQSVPLLHLSALVPVVPDIQEHFQADFAVAFLTVSSISFGLGIGQLFAGAIIEAYGRRKSLLVLLSAALVIDIFSVMTYFSSLIWLLIILRFLSGIALCVCVVVAFSVGIDVYSGTKLVKINSYIVMSACFCSIFFPILSRIIAKIDGHHWTVTFIVFSVYVAAILLLVFFKLPETKDMTKLVPIVPKVIFTNYLKLLLDTRFLAFVFILGSAQAGVYDFLLYFSTMDPVKFIIIGLMMPAGCVINSAIAGKVSKVKLMTVGIVIEIVVCAVMTGFALVQMENQEIIMAALMVYMFGFSLITANAVSTIVQFFTNVTGYVSALANCILNVFVALTGLFFGALGISLITFSALPLVLSVISVVLIARFGGRVPNDIEVA